MKKSRIHQVIWMSVMVWILSAGCSDFLEIAPKSFYAENNMYQNVGHVDIAVKGIYNSLTAEALYGRNMTMYYDLDTDVSTIKGGTSTGSPDGERRSIARYVFTPETKQMNNAWSALYNGIERANIAISKIPQMSIFTSGTEEEKKQLNQYLGEALTLRAIMYFDLVRLWGDVPFKTTPSYTGEDFQMSRVSRDVIYDHIISDLEDAVEMLLWADEVKFEERITKGAAKGILARICLHAAGYSLRWDLETGTNMSMRTRGDEQRIRELYTIARDQASDIIQNPVHQLNPSYADIWMNICNYKIESAYKENIFELAFYSIMGTAGQSGNFGSYNGTECGADTKYGKASGAVWAMPSFYLMFEQGDVRRDVSMCDLLFKKAGDEKGVPSELYNIAAAKWRKNWAPEGPPELTNFNYPMLRYSDVLLMFAEADSWLAGRATAAAVDAVKQVRLRAFPDDEQKIEDELYPTDFDSFLDIIDRERALELAFEGFRKFDLIRWNKLAKRIQETKEEIAVLNGCYDKDGNTAYYGEVLHRHGEIFPQKRYYQDQGGDYVVVVDSKSGLPGTWTSANWLNSKFEANMEQFAVGFVANKCEIFPIPKEVRDVVPSISQVPGY